MTPDLARELREAVGFDVASDGNLGRLLTRAADAIEEMAERDEALSALVKQLNGEADGLLNDYEALRAENAKLREECARAVRAQHEAGKMLAHTIDLAHRRGAREGT